MHGFTSTRVIRTILQSPSSSEWLKATLKSALDCECKQVLSDIQTLAYTLTKVCQEMEENERADDEDISAFFMTTRS